MRDIPIIFSGPMVRALLDGRKTMTRRLAWREVEWPEDCTMAVGREVTMPVIRDGQRFMGLFRRSPWQKVQPGDRLWVRENWRADSPDDPQSALYMADNHAALPVGFKWRPSIHMPRWASRLTLIVTATKIERLQDIGEEDAKAEGAQAADLATGRECILDPGYGSYRLHFADIWRTLHGAESWDANPEVVALTFAVHKANIARRPDGL